MKRVLIVEDEPVLAARLERVLGEEGYAADAVHDGRAALARAGSETFDLLILDWLLPDRSGILVLRGLRAAGVAVPVLMLTARAQVEDRVEGLDAGADDYLTKPFALAELLARVRALIRRPATDAVAGELVVGDLVLDPVRHRVRWGERPVELTAREFALLHTLARRPGQVFTRALLLETVWGFPGEVHTNAVELAVSRLRRKLDRAGEPSCIRTVRSVGYSLELPEREAS